MTLDSVGGEASRSLPWIALDKWATRLLNIAVLLVLGRLLDVSAIGLVALAQVFVSFASVFVDAGFSKALVQRRSLDAIHSSTAFWASLTLSVVLAAAVVAASPLIATLFSSPELTPVLSALAGVLIINAFASVPAALLEREFRFRELAIRRVSGAFAGGSAGLTVALLGFGVWSLVAQALVTALVGAITIWVTSQWRPTAGLSANALKELWAVGVGVLGIELVGLLNSQSDRLLIGAFLSPEALGYYFMAMRLVSLVVELFSSVFSTISLTSLSRLQDDRPAMLAWLYKLASASCAVAVPIFAIAAIVAPGLFPLVIGEQWVPSVLIFQVLCGLGALNSLAYFDRSVLLAVKRPGAAFGLTLGQSVLGVLLVLVAVQFGVFWVAVAVTARQYLFWPIRLWFLRKYASVNGWQYFGRWLRPSLLSGLVIVAVLGSTALLPAVRENDFVYVVTTGAVSVLLLFAGTRYITPSTYADARDLLLRRRG
ncbi:hypothetical protein A9Z40_12830 [Microbacterium arborescens]|uniref:Uncharacterized protein n=1 Tax=Microbacterium arborescens TaxID=33883 RepID=A0ABX2WLE2_9MICO|nr:lipopolysaccharide biosynthesis protein [Microbacterium arborescens]OAZ44269.1 hypothetical protein A9Z40_12830 [Microbacterium arborescens]